MSTFNNGGGTLKSTNKVAALLEAAHTLNEAERAASTADNPVENVDITYAITARTATITATLPTIVTISPQGELITKVNTTYLPGSVFNPGDDGDLKSTSLPGAFVEAAYMVNLSEPTGTNNVSISTDDDGTMTITATIPIVPSLDSSGRTVQTAVDYLP